MYPVQILKRAYLIGAPGGPVNHTKELTGVGKDLRRVKRFLKSKSGGQWLDSEIIVLSWAEFSLIRHQLANTHADYRLIYFSGHGFYKDGRNHLMFQDGWVLDTDLIHPFIEKQEILCDSCRTFVDLGRISGITPRDEWKNFKGDDLEVHHLFNDWVTDSPNGVQIFHAVPPGIAALDTPDGGMFTNSLLDAAENDMTAYEDYSFATLRGIVDYLNHPQISRYRPYLQPQLTYEEGYLNVPFAVGMPASMREAQTEVVLPEPATVSQGINWGGLALFALGVTAAAALIDNRK